MFAHLSRQGTHPQAAARQAGARLRRLAAVLAAATCGLLASAVAATAAFAQPIPVGDGGNTVAPVPASTVRVITTGGTAGWQIALIALGAALAAAAAAALLDRLLGARRTAPGTTA